MTGNNLIEPLTVGCSHILHIVNVLKASLYFERNGSCFHQFLQIIYLAKVFQGQQMTSALYHASFTIYQIKRQTAELSTSATVGTASETILRGITLSAVTHTKGTMHKHFQFYIWDFLMNLTNLFNGELTG